MAETNLLQQLKYYYGSQARDLPWRRPASDGSFDAYHILVSEVMLQQTQVNRVMPKFQQFLDQFPTLRDLATADLAAVLVQWAGLGYNRRAKYLWLTAQLLAGEPQPWRTEVLHRCPGVGVNTAAAIRVYAYNQPEIFIETNIRTVYIHHYFADQLAVPDSLIRATLAATLDRAQPRQFYWAVMDYGTHLKATVGNLTRQSTSYTKQSTFKGSTRSVRGHVLRILMSGYQTEQRLLTLLNDERSPVILADLIREQLVEYDNGTYHLPTS
ncbi:MAG: endonuclease III [Candidatus Saccharimonadales bacterium]